MVDDEIKLASWIAETRRKLADFITPVSYLRTSLDYVEKLVSENKRLRGALSDMVSDLNGAPQNVTYDRDSLKDWLQAILVDQKNLTQ
jgi:hypothetical protein